MCAASAPSSFTNRKRPSKYKCKVCGIDFNSTEELRAHVKLEHSADVHSPAGVS